jgi:hypothetical protein
MMSVGSSRSDSLSISIVTTDVSTWGARCLRLPNSPIALNPSFDVMDEIDAG